MKDRYNYYIDNDGVLWRQAKPPSLPESYEFKDGSWGWETYGLLANSASCFYAAGLRRISRSEMLEYHPTYL